MNFSDIDDFYRSRLTLLDVLDSRGYDTKPYRKFSPLEISKALLLPADGFKSLGFVAKKLKEDDPKVCMVEYLSTTRTKLSTYFDEYPTTDLAEIIVMITDSVMDLHHLLSLSLYMTKKIHVSFFSVFHLVNNPLNHVLVPKHEILSSEEETTMMKKYHVASKSKLPLIRYHVDPIIRLIGAVPGNIIKITRPSESAGETLYYRYVSA